MLFGVLYGIKYTIIDSGLIPKSIKESKAIAVDNLPPLSYDKNANAPFVVLPVNNVTSISAVERRIEVMGWNAQMGLMRANGGISTTEGSFMEKQGVRLKIICQNDCNKQAEDLYTFAASYKNDGKNTGKGTHFIAWMGDGVPSYIAGLNKRIKKDLGPEYIAQVICAMGSSFGEDKFLGQPEWKRDPQKAKGSIIVCVVRDGDWNIVMKWASDNNIKVNNDLTTYDPDAINFMGVDDYVKASQAYVSGTREKRAIVINGKRAGRDTSLPANGVATWTPGDVVACQQKGGLVTVASTADYSAQMACTVIGIKQFMQDNRKEIESFILALCQGGDQVKSHNSALQFASEVSAQVYNDDQMKPADWYKYYKGFDYTDNQGNRITLGGSRVFNLADNADYFGISSRTNKYKAVYETFGKIVVDAYPEIVKEVPVYDEVVDLSYLVTVYSSNKNNVNMAPASNPTFRESDKITQVVSDKATYIEFATGSATISPKSKSTLVKIAQDLTIANNLLVQISGHTDNIGNSTTNQQLSERRAESVKNWLTNNYPDVFTNKITAAGYGDSKPIAPNETEDGRSRNRRV